MTLDPPHFTLTPTELESYLAKKIELHCVGETVTLESLHFTFTPTELESYVAKCRDAWHAEWTARASQPTLTEYESKMLALAKKIELHFDLLEDDGWLGDHGKRLWAELKQAIKDAPT